MMQPKCLKVAGPATAMSVDIVSTMISRRRKTVGGVVFVILVKEMVGIDEWMGTDALRIVHQDLRRDKSVVESIIEYVMRRCGVFIDVAWRRETIAAVTTCERIAYECVHSMAVCVESPSFATRCIVVVNTHPACLLIMHTCAKTS
jgi:hypothetical protein